MLSSDLIHNSFKGIDDYCIKEVKSLIEKISFVVEKTLCEECSLALRRFIGGIDGVESIDVEEGKIAVLFNGDKITEADLSRLTRESIEKLGYGLQV